MKKNCLRSILLILFTASVTLGQQNKFNIGITGGPNLNLLSGYHPASGFMNKPITYFSTGLTFEYNLPKTISFLTGILYEAKGTEISGSVLQNNVSTVVKSKDRLNYYTLPLLLRASFGKTIKGFINAGGYVSYLQHAQSNLVTDAKANYYSSNIDYAYNKWDAGIMLGLGISMPIGSRFLLSLEARGSHGLRNVDIYYNNNSSSIRTNSASLLFGLAYKLGKRS